MKAHSNLNIYKIRPTHMRIALLDDHLPLLYTLKGALTPHGYYTQLIKSSEIKFRVSFDDFGLVIINSDIEHISAVDFIKRLRGADFKKPVILIDSGEDHSVTVKALEAGADDSIKQPFRIQELVARVRSISRRPEQYREDAYTVNKLKIDRLKRSVTYNKKPLNLRNKEFQILDYMSRNLNRPISRSELMDNIWEGGYEAGSNCVDVHISNLRKKIQNRKLIQTVHGYGYIIKNPAQSKRLDSDKIQPLN